MPEQSVTIDMVTGVGEIARGRASRWSSKYQDRHLADRVFDLAWTHSQVALRQINATEADAQLYGAPGQLDPLRQSVAARRARRPDAATAAGNPACGATRSPATCRSCCCRSRDPANIELVRQLVQAHAYWRLKGLAVDLVIWNEDHAGYRQVLQDQIMGLIAAGVEAHVVDRPGGIFVRRAEQIADEDRDPAAVGRPRRRQRQRAERWPSRSTAAWSGRAART